MKYFLLIALFLVSAHCFSTEKELEKPIKWVTDSWPNYTDQDGTGLYHDLMRAIFHETDEFHVQYAPWLRSLELVKSGAADLTGAMPLNSTYIMSKNVVLSQPISVLVKTEKKEAIIHNGLMGLVGVWRSGYYKELVNDDLKKQVEGVATENADSGFNLVRYNRVDYFIDVRTMLTTHLAKQEDREAFTLIDIGHLNLHMAFSKSERGREIATLFDQRFSQLSTSGKLKALYTKYQQALPNQ